MVSLEPPLMPSIAVQKEVVSQLTADARANALNECCGLLAGRDGVITDVFPAVNAGRRSGEGMRDRA